MSNVTISDLPDALTLTGAEYFPLMQSGKTSREVLSTFVAFRALLNSVVVKSATHATVAGDIGKLINFTTAGCDLTLTAAVGGAFAVRNSAASGLVTLKSTATIDGVAGATGIPLAVGDSCFVVFDGANFKTVGRANSVGTGQVWTSVTRTSGVTYYNTTGRPIEVAVMSIVNNTGAAGATLTVGGVQVGDSLGYAAAIGMAQGMAYSAIVPPGAAYVITGASYTVAELS